MGSRSAPARRPAPAPAARTPAPVHSSTPAPMQSSGGGGGMLSGIGSTIAQGMAFGTGSAIAHRAVGAAAEAMTGGGGGGANEAAPQPAPIGAGNNMQQVQGVCGQDKQMFYECLQVNRGDQQACNFLYEQLQQCQRGQDQVQFG